MFTGIITQIGTVTDVGTTDDGRRLVLAGQDFAGLRIGDSIAIDGVCLTAVEIEGNSVAVDVVPETLSRTTMGNLYGSDRVNIELAMSAAGRFDGHIVQGHVDGVGEVVSVDRSEGATTMTVRAEERLMSQIVEKGSIAIDGVSLTVAGMNGDTFSVALIPHTLEATTLGLRSAGDAVNLETDIIAKYVEKMTQAAE